MVQEAGKKLDVREIRLEDRVRESLVFHTNQAYEALSRAVRTEHEIDVEWAKLLYITGRSGDEIFCDETHTGYNLEAAERDKAADFDHYAFEMMFGLGLVRAMNKKLFNSGPDLEYGSLETIPSTRQELGAAVQACRTYKDVQTTVYHAAQRIGFKDVLLELAASRA